MSKSLFSIVVAAFSLASFGAIITNDLGRIVTSTQLESVAATADEALAEAGNTKTIVQTWESFLDGSNVVFSITNYISGTYNLDTAKFRILELKNGEYHEVYNSRDDIVLHINDFKSNELANIIAEVNQRINSKAEKAWGRYTSTGGEAPSNTVYITEPSTVFAGGMEYERVAVGQGAVCVLTDKGAPVYTQGDEGTFKFQDDGGTNYFGFAKTDSYTIGCNTDGISVQSNVVTLEYDITMSGVPCIWYCESLVSHPIIWEQLNTPDGQPIAGASHTVQWDENPPVGKELCYINCPEGSGFFKATVEVPGDAKFMTNMPADLSGGILCRGVNNALGVIKPTFNGSTVTWTWSAK